MPLRAAAACYVTEYMAKPHTPTQPPPELSIIAHLGNQASQSLWPALAGAMQNQSVSDNELRMVTVRRRKAAMPSANMPLQSWVSFRVAQGVDVAQAVQEWNGWQLAARGIQVAETSASQGPAPLPN